MLPWQFFSTALSESSNSLIGNANLISKVYFPRLPRLIVPAGSVITSFVDFLITLGLMALLMLWYGFLPDWRLMTLPLFMALAFGAAFGGGIWLCALNVKYCDFRYIVPFIVQFGLYVSPVGFSSDLVPERWRLLYACNPMVGVIDGFRWALLRGESKMHLPSLLASILITIVLCFSGAEELVSLRNFIESDVRAKLNIPFNRSAPAIRYEHSMGQSGILQNILRRSPNVMPQAVR
jgi:lipopolysaccharide transport system permease protein